MQSHREAVDRLISTEYRIQAWSTLVFHEHLRHDSRTGARFASDVDLRSVDAGDDPATFE